MHRVSSLLLDFPTRHKESKTSTQVGADTIRVPSPGDQKACLCRHKGLGIAGWNYRYKHGGGRSRLGRQRTLSIGLVGGATGVVCGGCGVGRSDRLEIQSGPADGMFWVLEQEQFGWEQEKTRMALWVLEEALKMRGHCREMRLIERRRGPVASLKGSQGVL